MLVKFKTSLVGHIVIKPGEVVEMLEAEARRHVGSGNAVPADAVETAVFRAREKALAEETRKQETAAKKAEETRRVVESR